VWGEALTGMSFLGQISPPLEEPSKDPVGLLRAPSSDTGITEIESDSGADVSGAAVLGVEQYDSEMGQGASEHAASDDVEPQTIEQPSVATDDRRDLGGDAGSVDAVSESEASDMETRAQETSDGPSLRSRVVDAFMTRLNSLLSG
jgi:hypothetical protein